MSTEIRTVTVEREFSHPPDRLWRALTQPHLMEEWLLKVKGFAPVVGQDFNLSGEWGGVECKVLVVEPNKALSYTWDYNHEDPTYALKSVVVFTLTPTSAGTHLRMEQTGFRPDQKQALGGATYGWNHNLGRLDELLSRGV